MTYEGRKQFHETMISLGKESPYAKEFEKVKPKEPAEIPKSKGKK